MSGWVRHGSVVTVILIVPLLDACVRVGFRSSSDGRPERDANAVEKRASVADRTIEQTTDRAIADRAFVFDATALDQPAGERAKVLDQRAGDRALKADLWHPPCVDQDLDGWTTCQGDCDDADPKVFPGQTSFFTVQSVGGTFDYNCDGKVELKLATAFGGCAGLAPSCTGSVAGWTASPPPCGVTASWTFCQGSTPASPCKLSGATATQSCR